MAQRRRVIIFYSYNKNWIGGTYYIQNLISTLNNVVDEKQPQLLIVTDTDQSFEDLKFITGYPYLKRHIYRRQSTLIERGINYYSRKLLKFNLIDYRVIKNCITFPSDLEFRKKLNHKMLFWIPDFQDKHLPSFFEEAELEKRKEWHLAIINKGKHLVFSSVDAQNDFNTFYPKNKINQYVLPFAVIHPRHLKLSQVKVFDKFKITSPYFLCANQFWVHKNHIVVFKAIKKLKLQGNSVKVYFTGQQNDYRNPAYFNSLQKLIDELDIKDEVEFLGFIEREEQLILLQNAQAIIQPSLFEGWSTVVEDVKAQNNYVIASNLRVHREQLIHYPNHSLFDPKNATELASQMLKKFNKTTYNYNQNIKTVAESFVKILDQIEPLN